MQSERDVRETHCTAETNFMGKNLSTCLKKTADTGNVFSCVHLSSYHALFRNVHVCDFCALNVLGGFWFFGCGVVHICAG